MKAHPGLFVVLILLCALFTFAQDKTADVADAPDAADGISVPKAAETGPVPVAGWEVTFYLSSNLPKKLFFMQLSDGTGLFYLAGPRGTVQPTVANPAVWYKANPDFMSFSSEAQFPLGNCCRETGTLNFKGNLPESGPMTGRVTFISDTPDPASPTGYLTKTGNFSAISVLVIAGPE